MLIRCMVEPSKTLVACGYMRCCIETKMSWRSARPCCGRRSAANEILSLQNNENADMHCRVIMPHSSHCDSGTLSSCISFEIGRLKEVMLQVRICGLQCRVGCRNHRRRIQRMLSTDNWSHNDVEPPKIVRHKVDPNLTRGYT